MARKKSQQDIDFKKERRGKQWEKKVVISGIEFI
jgi:hypothetical protein